MLIRPLGQLTWNSDGMDICFTGNDDFLAIDDGDGVQQFSLKTGKPKNVWESKYEALGVILRTGENRFFVGGSYGIGYDLVVGADGEFHLQGQRKLLQYFDCAAFAEEEQLLAVCWYHLIRIVPLDANSATEPVEVNLEKRRIFAIAWVSDLKKFLVVSPKGLFTVSPNGELAQLPTPDAEILAAVALPGTGKFVCAVGSGQTVTVFQATFDSPERHLWDTSFVQRPKDSDGYKKGALSNSACLVYDDRNKEFVLSCCASVRRISIAGEIFQEVQLPSVAVTLAMSPDQQHIAIGNRNCRMFVLTKDGHILHPRTCHGKSAKKLLFSNDESRLYSIGIGSPEVFCWDVIRAIRLWEYWSAFDKATDLVETTDGGVLFCRDGFELHGATLCEMTSEGTVKPVFPLDGFDGMGLQYDSGSFVIVRGTFGPRYECQLRHFPSGKIQQAISLGEHAPKFVAKHKALVCIHDKYHIWLVDLSKAGNKLEFAPPTEDDDFCIFFDSDSSVVVVSATGIFRTPVKRCQWKKLIDFDSPAVAAGFAVNGTIVIALANNTVEFRRIADWSLTRSESVVFEGATISCCTLSPSERFLAVGASDGRMAICTLD